MAKRHDRQAKMKWKYGITEEQRRQMYFDQNGECGLCHRPISYDETDHDHNTDRVRGLVCHKCNMLIGKVEYNQKMMFSNG